MSNRFFIEKIDRRTAQLIGTLTQIAAVWTASDAGYYLLLPLFGAKPDYNAASVAITLYYGFWIGIAVITFWPLYSSWLSTARGRPSRIA